MGCATIKPNSTANPESRINAINISVGTFVTSSNKSFLEAYNLGPVISTYHYHEIRKVTFRETNEERSVKIFKTDTAPQAARDRLRTEISIVKQLDHPSIIKFYEIFEESKKILIAMENCKGGELFDEILKRKCFTERQAAQIMKEIFSGLAYLHDKGVVHRDLKPENVLLEDKGDLLNIKLVNFGSATTIKGGFIQSGLVGTAYYIAPEIIKGKYNEKCDLWSAGVILFMLLSSYPPFDGNSDREILDKVLIGQPNLNEQVWDSISPSAKDFISALLCPEPARLSAVKALSHPWIQLNINHPPETSSNIFSAFSNLKAFHRCNKLRDAVQTFIAAQCITRQESKDLKEAFKVIDTNGDGKLSYEELLEHYQCVIGPLNSEQEVKNIMKEVDTDNNGYINYTEFLKASISQKVLVSSQNLRRAFDLFDTDKNGKIDAKELKRVLQAENHYDDKVWKDLIHKFDQNEDGEIDLREFEEIITRNF